MNMAFTVVFKSIFHNLSYLLVFEPCPIWVKHTSWLINLNPQTPEYQIGSLRKLIEYEQLEPFEEKKCILIVQQDAICTQRDMDTIEADLRLEGFSYKVIQL